MIAAASQATSIQRVWGSTIPGNDRAVADPRVKCRQGLIAPGNILWGQAPRPPARLVMRRHGCGCPQNLGALLSRQVEQPHSPRFSSKPTVALAACIIISSMGCEWVSWLVVEIYKRYSLWNEQLRSQHNLGSVEKALNDGRVSVAKNLHGTRGSFAVP